ncbi:hypothetical protein SAMN06265784_11679 [Paraburkholderia susongensis]|uniref:Uncharacterized protein n=1 Tax=Paraburkholderia susongensis TaxID=1515439 RepID=A0A1X7M2P1_9BURK|nr:hypothetical protein SAMN06265784_11679 [Paraburkholderia susongensis]
MSVANKTGLYTCGIVAPGPCTAAVWNREWLG